MAPKPASMDVAPVATFVAVAFIWSILMAPSPPIALVGDWMLVPASALGSVAAVASVLLLDSAAVGVAGASAAFAAAAAAASSCCFSFWACCSERCLIRWS